MNNSVILNVIDLKKYFAIKRGLFTKDQKYIKAVDGISFFIEKGETLGLVGESGCGKTTTGRLILNLITPTAGKVYFEGKDIFSLTMDEMTRLRTKLQLIFQDPFSSLNPRMTMGSMLREIFLFHKLASKKDVQDKIADILQTVGLSPEFSNRYPHEFSSGQRQRIVIARALSVNPEFIVADEPVSALDVSVQAQILNLLSDLKKQFDLSMLFIAHDLSVVYHICNRVAVMYLGKIVEMGNKKHLFHKPHHPYTEALIASTPELTQITKKKSIILGGEVPDLLNLPSGCSFHPRCKYNFDRCRQEEPALREIEKDYLVKCHLNGGTGLS